MLDIELPDVSGPQVAQWIKADEVQDTLAANRHEHSFAVGAEAPSLLAGLIVDSDGNRMTPTHATKKAKRYRYYVSASFLAGDRLQARKGMRIPAGDIEGLILDRLRAFFSPRTEILWRAGSARS